MNPYPGLRPFKPSEERFFMGREIVSDRIVTQSRISALTLMFARSGIGKSSFLTCRLIPLLERDSAVCYLNEWGSEEPMDLITRQHARLSANHNDYTEKPILVLDQFEDIFKVDQDRERLWEGLAEIVNVNDPSAHVLISMREEWLGAWYEAAEYMPAALSSALRLTPLSNSEILRAINNPAKIEGGISVASDLAERILKDISRPNAYGLGENYAEAGLLQIVCRRLWREAERSGQELMTISVYEALGGANSMIKEFVWDELGGAGSDRSRFTSFDRVLWVGLTRHLVFSQGVKAIVSPRSISRKLSMQDLGAFGPAVIKGVLGQDDRKYLETKPETREEPSRELVKWISTILNKGVSVGFLKKQADFTQLHSRRATEPIDATGLFELSHDSIGDILQEFSTRFESWSRVRFVKFYSAVMLLFWVIPVFLYHAYTEDLVAALVAIGIMLALFSVYIIVVILLVRVFDAVFQLFFFPAIRLLSRGKIEAAS